MGMPPLFVGSTLLFWGWQAGFLWLAVPMAVFLEAPRWVATRWEFSDREFQRMVDLGSLICVIALIYAVNKYAAHGLFNFLTWLPLLLFLLPLAQVYSTRDGIKFSALFLSQRKAGPDHRMAHRALNILYPYVVLCLLSASVAHSDWFFPGLCALAGWGLWGVRSPRYSLLIWGSLALSAGGLGYVGQIGIHQAQLQLEEWVLAWFEQSLWQSRDPYRQHTSIGDIGELKLSNRILFRVQAAQPVLLREASYSTYRRGTWRAGEGVFADLAAPRQGGNWIEETPRGTSREVTVFLPLPAGKGMLPLPTGTHQVRATGGLEVQRNPYGAFRVEQGPGLLRYQAAYGDGTPLDQPPTQDDLEIPGPEAELVREVATELGLSGLPPAAAVTKVAAFFEDNFRYSLFQDLPPPGFSPLSHFLRGRRAGHCEYFATAATLLLRAADVPTRYAAGYAAEEFSDLENAYVVRRRHAHAWTLVYLDGRWVDLDTTPAVWVEMEAENVPWWEPVYDLGAWLSYLYSRWSWRETEEGEDYPWILWLLPPLLGFLLWRLAKRRRVRRQSGKTRDTGETLPVVGADSAFYQVVAYLESRGHARPQGEPLARWLAKIEEPALDTPALRDMLGLHHRYRFDPEGLEEPARARLRHAVEAWLAARRTGDQ